ncbi:MAG: GNAT family N-acetyltransferase [Promethearchaeia archaeon]
MKNDQFSNLQFEQLTDTNIRKVYEMCEKSVRFLSKSLQTFRKATLESDLFEKEFSTVVLDKDRKVIGFFLIVFREPFVLKRFRKVAVLKFFVIAEDWRYKGLGSFILKKLTARIKNSEHHCFKMKMEVMASMPDYWHPGLDPRHTEAFFFLKKHGFKKKGERVNLCVDLSPISEEKPASKINEFQIARATKEEEDKVAPIKFMPKRYQLSFWPQEIRLSFRNDPITTFVAKNERREIIGWASHSIHFPKSFGPAGVAKNARGKGLGSVLLEWCLWDLKRQGFEEAKIMWVVGDTIYFYLKSRDAHICEFFWPMQKRI